MGIYQKGGVAQQVGNSVQLKAGTQQLELIRVYHFPKNIIIYTLSYNVKVGVASRRNESELLEVFWL